MAVVIAEQRYGPTTGAVTGWFGLVICVGGTVLALSDPTSGRVRIALLLCLLGMVFWCYLLRPKVIVREGVHLVLRNAFSSWEIPLAAITDIRIKAITRVDAGGRSYDGMGVGKRVRKLVRGAATNRLGAAALGAAPAGGELRERDRTKPNSPEAVADLVADQVLAAVERAKEAGQPAGPVRRRWAWPEIVLLVGLTAAFAATHL